MGLGIVPKLQRSVVSKLNPGFMKSLCESPTGPFTGKLLYKSFKFIFGAMQLSGALL